VKNSKTDAADVGALAEYAAWMDFVAWARPSNEKLALRSLAQTAPCNPRHVEARQALRQHALLCNPASVG
jgi:hypothetical protein